LIKDFHPQNKEVNLDEVIGMTEDDFKERFKISPIKRAKLSGLKRNASYLKNN
jgi:epoxyqueuosine reductase